MQQRRYVFFILLLTISPWVFAQYSITGDATQTIDFTGFTGAGFQSGGGSGTLDSDIWGVDLSNDGTMDSDFGDTNTGGVYAGGETTSQWNVGGWPPGQVRAYTYNIDKLGVRNGYTGYEGDIALILRLQNSTGGDITSLDLAYDVYSRVIGGTAAEIEFYYSADNSSYTEIVAMGTSFAPTTNWGQAATELTGSISATISNGSYYYLKWVVKEHDADNAAIAFTDIDITATIAAGSGEGTITAGTTNFGDLPSTVVADPGEDVFDFTIADDASTGSDAFPIQFTDVVFTEGASDAIDDWSDVIAGARLEDSGGNAINATSISANSITFSGIGITSGDVGYVPDDGNETFTLSVWLNTTISEEIDGDLLHIDLSGADFTFSGATSTITVTESASSNTSYNSVEVSGTNWGFDSPPTTVGVDEDFTLIIASMDAYGNIDLDDNTSTFILSRGSTGSNNLTEGGASKNALSAKTLTSGRYTYTDLQYDSSEDFDIDADDSGGTYLTSATSSAITAAVSYQSIASGNWTADFATIWQYWNGTTWTTATTYPSSTTGTIYIRSGHDISVDADISVDQVIIENGGEISMDQNADVLTVADGPGDDLIIQSGGTLSLSNYNALPTITGTIQVQGGGTFSCSVGRLNNIGTSTQIDWQTDAVFYYTDGGAFAYNTTYFPSVAAGTYPIFEVDGFTTATNNLWTLNGILKVTSATLNISGTGTTIRDGILADGDVTLGNATDFTGTTLHFGGSGSIDLDGESYSWSGKTIALGADQEIYNGTISLDGSSTIDAGAYSLNDGANDNLNVTIANGAIINCNAATGLAATLAAGGTITLGSALDYNFSGSTAQTLNFGTVGVTAADRVTVDNSSGVTLNSDLTINERLTLTNGIFSTSSSSEVITISSSGIIVGASSTNYFDGPLEVQNFTSAYTFHVGDGSDYRPVTLDPVNASDFTIQHFTSAPTDNSDLTSPLTSLLTTRYWTIDRSSGTGNVEVTLNFDAGADGLSGSSDLRVSRYNTTTTSWEESGTGYDSHTSTSVTSTTSAFSDFTVASTSSALPVTLVSFRGQSDEGKITLEWHTANELNNSHFDVEKSANGTDFSVMGRVQGNGTTNETQYYSFVDPAPVQGYNYYRLHQVDFDGTSEYSKTILVLSDPNSVKYFNIRQPDPATLEVEVSAAIPGQQVRWVLTDISGRKLLDQRTLAPAPVFVNEIELAGNRNLYILNIFHNGNLATFKVFRQ